MFRYCKVDRKHNIKSISCTRKSKSKPGSSQSIRECEEENSEEEDGKAS